MEEQKDLKLYGKYLEDIMRQKDHVLSAREESILAQMGEVANSPEKIFFHDERCRLKISKDKGGGR